jgi:hypothetical protein
VVVVKKFSLYLIVIVILINVFQMFYYSATIAWAGSILAGVTWIVGPVVGGLINKFGCRSGKKNGK